MQNYDTFVFDSYEFSPEKRTIELHYNLTSSTEVGTGAIQFTEKIMLPDKPIAADPESPALHRALFALHLICGISYYKTCLPKKIDVRSGKLTGDQAQFWNTVYENGLGEFFFKNQIDFHDVVHFEGSAATPPIIEKKRDRPAKKRVLIPLGGGKDSVLTAEMMKSSDFDCVLFRMGSHPFIESLATQIGLPMITVERHLARELFALNEEGALNGHVPVTAYLSFLTVVMAMLYDFDAVAMSNERSASEGNVTYYGKEINHQWSKSLEFERLFQSYIQNYVTQDVASFSALRPLTELHIASLFAQLPQYFDHVTSCNANWKILGQKPRERWCGHCPKCAFSFTLFSAFLPREQLIKMFGKDLFAEEALLPLYKELLGLEGTKPFECVGTPEETAAAFLLARVRGGYGDTAVMKLFEEAVLPKVKDAPSLIQQQLTPSDDHAIPIAYSVTLQ